VLSKITPFLMFDGKAGDAMRFYTSVFTDSEIEQIERYGADGPGVEGSVMRTTFRIGDQRFIFFNSPDVHAFGFTPAISLFVDFQSEADLDAAFSQLSDGGEILMPLDIYPFSDRFAWLNDRFGVSWQLNLVRT
jgi:predicted 3-demethylubiquinone-9 3-methyltransferase (glyoxalase superfamily)